jgi:hypothetical protein
MVNGAIDGRAFGQGGGRVPEVQWEPQWLAVEALGEDDALRRSLGEM